MNLGLKQAGGRTLPSRETRLTAERLRPLAYWIVPPAFALVLYWPGLMMWFSRDDFAWLSLLDLVRHGRTLRWAMFQPLAQGTIRVLSERLVNLIFVALFGLHAFPFRLLAVGTFCATLPLLAAVVTRITGSRTAGFCAAILWTANSTTAIPLSWTAVYYEVLLGFFLILDFWLLLKYIDTGERRYFVWQWIAYLAGFGVMEMNVIYPALALLYALCCARRLVPKVLPMFVPAVAYAVVHFRVAPAPTAGPYKMYWDAHMIPTLARYWEKALGPNGLALFGLRPSPFRWALALGLTLGMATFVVVRLRRSDWRPVFFLGWFFVATAPLLPLREHIMDYYAFIPAAGLAMLAGWAAVVAWHSGLQARGGAILLAGIYLGVNVPVARIVTNQWWAESHRAREAVLGVVARSRPQPAKIVFLTHYNEELFWAVIHDRALEVFGVGEWYLMPDEAARVPSDRDQRHVSVMTTDWETFRRALAENRALVLDLGGGRVRDTTTAAEAMAARHREVIEIGKPSSDRYLGSGWYAVDPSGIRWMSRRATLEMEGVPSSAAKLSIAGYCPAAALRIGPIRLIVTVDGQRSNPLAVAEPDSRFVFEVPLPPTAAGKKSIPIALELDRTFTTPEDTRELGLALLSISAG